MRHRPESEHPGVRFAPGVAHALQEPFDLRGFTVADPTPRQHEVGTDGEPGLEIAAV